MPTPGHRERVYQIRYTFEIRAVEREWHGPGPLDFSDRWTNEALNIQDNHDLAEATTLTAVLAKIDAIHQQLKQVE